MDWQAFAVARQLLAEERVGTKVRAAQAQEDAAFTAASKALGRRDGVR